MDDHGIHIGYVQSGLNDGSCHQYVDLPAYEVKHDLLQFLLLHLPVGEGNHGLGYQRGDPGRHIRNVVHPVVHIIDLPAPGHFPGNRLPDQLLVVLADKSLDGLPVLGRLLQNAHVPDPHQAHVQGPGNGGGCQGQHIHVLLQLLDLFLVAYPETLFLINDQQSQILKLHVRRKYPVCADDDVHPAFYQVCHRLPDLSRGAEPAHQIHPYGVIFHTLDEGGVMLLCQNSGGYQVHHLLSLLDSLECGPDGDLRLAVAHIAADKPVHDSGALHVRLGVLDGRNLVFRLLKGKHFLKLPLPYRILFILVPLAVLPQGIELHQILSHFTDGAANLRLGALPLFGTQFVQFRLPGIGRGILLDHIQSGGKHIQIAAVPVLYLDVVLHHALHLHLIDSTVDSQAVAFMHHVVPHLQLIEILDFLALVQFPGPLLFFLRAKDVRLRKHHKFQQRIFEALVYMAVAGKHLPGKHLPHGILRIYGGNLLITQILRQPLCPHAGTGQKQHSVVVSPKQLQVLHQRLKAVVVGGHVTGRHIRPDVRPEIAPGIHSGEGNYASRKHGCSHLLPAVQDVHLPR